MGLDKATITNLNTGDQIKVMFNPEEYSLDASSTIAEIGIPGLKQPPIQYVRGNARVLKMELFFDTFEAKSDVREATRRITALLNPDVDGKAPPKLLFSWGGLNIKCVLESVGQRFTMFLNDGTPVRARLSVSFKEYEEVETEVQRGLFLGPPAVHYVRAGDNLARIAGEYLGDPGAWREIATANNIDDPRRLVAGSALVIPTRKPRLRS